MAYGQKRNPGPAVALLPVNLEAGLASNGFVRSMFYDQLRPALQRAAFKKRFQGRHHHLFLVRGIQKYQIKSLRVGCQTVQIPADIPLNDPCHRIEPACSKISPYQANRRPAVIHQNRPASTTAKCLDGKRAGTGEQVQHLSILHPVAQNIKNRLPEAVCSRPNGMPRQAVQFFSP